MCEKTLSQSSEGSGNLHRVTQRRFDGSAWEGGRIQRGLTFRKHLVKRSAVAS